MHASRVVLAPFPPPSFLLTWMLLVVMWVESLVWYLISSTCLTRLQLPTSAPTVAPTVMPTQAPTYAPPVVVTLPPTSIDGPPGSATLNGYTSFPPGTPVTYHYEYFSTDPLNPVLTPSVSTSGTGGAATAQVCGGATGRGICCRAGGGGGRSRKRKSARGEGRAKGQKEGSGVRVVEARS